MVKKSKRGGSIAYKSVTGNILKSANCSIDNSRYYGELPGTAHNFHLTTGGARKRRRKRRRIKCRTKHRFKGGSSGSNIVLNSFVSDCISANQLNSYPKGGGRKKRTKRTRRIRKGGGSDWAHTQYSRSSVNMPDSQFNQFTNTGQNIAYGQNESCIYGGSMFN